MPSNFGTRIPYLFSSILLAVALLVSNSLFFPIEAKNGDFTFDLIHRDYSLKSPFYNSLLTHFQRQKNVFYRSINRINIFASTKVFPSGGEYLMKISYGTPPFETLAIIDTGSDLPWIQCLPCKNCYKAKFSPFNPKNSSTFKTVPCETKTCNELFRPSCQPDTKICQYEKAYGDNSYSIGDLSTESITLGGLEHKNKPFSNFVFGCGHDQDGLFPYEASGIVGFASGGLSLISQLKSTIHGKFSYCLGPSNEGSNSGKLNLGNEAVISGAGVVSTPLFLSSYYTLALEAISVDDKRLDYPIIYSNSNLIIDSGTTLTYLPPKFNQELVSTVKQKINSSKTVPDTEKIFTLCYPSLDGLQIPTITMHFKGASLKLLNQINTFVRTSPSSVCLAFVPNQNMHILGNVQQANFWVGYDLEKKMLSFKPADCTKE